MSKHLGNMSKHELQQAYLTVLLMEIDDMKDSLDNQKLNNVLRSDQVRGDINNPDEWTLLKRVGTDDLYPLSRALFRNQCTGEVIQGMFDESTGDKLLGEIIQGN